MSHKLTSMSTVWHCEQPPSGTVYVVLKERRTKAGVRHVDEIRILQEGREVRVRDVPR